MRTVRARTQLSQMTCQCELECKVHTFSFKVGCLDFLRTDQNDATSSTNHAIASSRYSSIGCMKNATHLKDIPKLSMLLKHGLILCLYYPQLNP